MLVLLWSLVAIYRGLDIADYNANAGTLWLVQIPFSLYLGWITVATIATASAVQSALYWNDLGFAAVTWTLIKLALAGAIAGIVSLRKNDVVFPLVVAWAAFAIAARQAGTPAVSGAATTIMLFAVFIALYEALRQYRAH
jgi:benzodiazapine receptor